DVVRAEPLLPGRELLVPDGPAGRDRPDPRARPRGRGGRHPDRPVV
ncbi:MAG: hypothetical protein AVDCRST_MAG05-2011, partial [uncultured Rubrobacteraceae bacterium]